MKKKISFLLFILSVLILSACTSLQHDSGASTCASHQHTGGVSTCVQGGACEICGYVYMEPLGHSYAGASCVKQGTCTLCGSKGGGYSDAHDFSGDADTCALCGLDYYTATLEFTLNDTGDAYTVSGIGSCGRTAITVPATYQGLPVTCIGADAFQEVIHQGDSRITAVSLPASVKKIEETAFKYCEELQTVTMPGVQEIGLQAFYNCRLLEQVALPEGLAKIDTGAFGRCVALREAVIPASVTEIGDGAFSGCISLKEMVFHDGIQSLGRGVVDYCTALETLYISSAISVIPEDLAMGCDALKTVTCGGSIQSIGASAFFRCGALESFDFGGMLESVGGCAFMECTSLTEVYLPDTVKSIGNGAFSGCTALRQLRIPSGLDTVGLKITQNCENLEYHIYEGMQYLGNEENPYLLFMGVADQSRKDAMIHDDTRFFWPNYTVEEMGLESLSWGKSLTSYWFDAMVGLSILERLEVSPENPIYMARGNCFIEKATKTLLHGCKASVIPDDGSVTVIGKMAFRGVKGLAYLVIPNTVETIGANVFVECENLQWLLIGSGVKTIDHDIMINANESCAVYYMGTEADWKSMKIVGSNSGFGFGGNKELLKMARYYYSETEPTEEGNFWHFVDGVPTPWE